MTRPIDQASFAAYVRSQWAKAGVEVSEEGPAPHREFGGAAAAFAFGVTLFRDEVKARVGVWYLPPGKTINDLGGLRAHYQGTLQKQNRFVRITNCGTELGTFFLFFDNTQVKPQEAFGPFVELVEACTAAAFDGDALDEWLESFR